MINSRRRCSESPSLAFFLASIVLILGSFSSSSSLSRSVVFGGVQAFSTDYDGGLCTSPNNVFHARVNLFAGELGYYVFEECGLDVMNPTIAMELGETYTFIQKDRTNYFHRKLYSIVCTGHCLFFRIVSNDAHPPHPHHPTIII